MVMKNEQEELAQIMIDTNLNLAIMLNRGIYARSSQVANALLENFSRDSNVICPVFGVISVGDLSSNLAKVATKINPFVHAGSFIADDLHAVLITGIYVVFLNPLRISVEIKNSYGKKWGNNGCTWIASGVLEEIGVPYMGSCDTRRKKVSTSERIVQTAHKICKRPFCIRLPNWRAPLSHSGQTMLSKPGSC
ncbi:uncharacterized protein LOC110873908 [Helianthus annuus]|uniref:uncharacterized protein LOC110873908 n=1 Tax=Helianthus annuus TaxID=4232 RepID=UPI00165307A0|nr:uncharacterized protein LOC110873908 [Helianthus annuus]